MKLVTVVMVLALALGVVAPASAQSTSNNNDEKKRAEVGVFFDYFKLQFLSANMYGVGGRAGFNIFHGLSIEGEMSYDFESSSNFNVISAGILTPVTANIRLIHALAGPKFEVGKGSIRFFVVAKAGILNFSIATPVTAGNVANQIANLSDGNNKVVYYPGGGIEIGSGRFGIRIEAGDEIFIDNGANHNLKASAGPVFRF